MLTADGTTISSDPATPRYSQPSSVLGSYATRLQYNRPFLQPSPTLCDLIQRFVDDVDASRANDFEVSHTLDSFDTLLISMLTSDSVPGELWTRQTAPRTVNMASWRMIALLQYALLQTGPNSTSWRGPITQCCDVVKMVLAGVAPVTTDAALPAGGRPRWWPMFDTLQSKESVRIASDPLVSSIAPALN